MNERIEPMQRTGEQGAHFDVQVSASAVSNFMHQGSGQGVIRKFDIRQDDMAAEDAECCRTAHIMRKKQTGYAVQSDCRADGSIYRFHMFIRFSSCVQDFMGIYDV